MKSRVAPAFNLIGGLCFSCPDIGIDWV